MKLFLSTIFIFVCLNNYSQTNDTIYILFKKDKLHSRKISTVNKSKPTPNFFYEYNKLISTENKENILIFHTVYDFDKDIPPVYKPKSFMKKMKKNGKVYTCQQFKKMGYESTLKLLNLLSSRYKNKIYIVDPFEKVKDSLYIREVKHFALHIID